MESGKGKSNIPIIVRIRHIVWKTPISKKPINSIILLLCRIPHNTKKEHVWWNLDIAMILRFEELSWMATGTVFLVYDNIYIYKKK